MILKIIIFICTEMFPISHNFVMILLLSCSFHFWVFYLAYAFIFCVFYMSFLWIVQ